MSDSKTEWRAEEYEGHMGKRQWCVSAKINGEWATIASGLDKFTAHKIAAVNELEAALENLCDACDRHAPNGNPFQDARYPQMEAGRAALAKSRGET